MKMAFETLLAVCALTSVAQAQFTYIQWHSASPKTWAAHAIDSVSNRPAEVRFTGTQPSADAGGEIASQLEGLRGAIPGGAFRHTLTAGSLPIGEGDSSANRDATHLPEEIQFNDLPSEVAEAIGEWPAEGDQRTLFRAVLAKLETDARNKAKTRVSDTGAIPTAEDASVPEPAFFGLVGVMTLLGIAVVRGWTGT